MFAVVEQQVVVLLADAAHCSSEGDAGVRGLGMVDHAQGLPLAEIITGAAQNFTTLEVVSHRAVAEVDAVVIEQAVLARYLEMISCSQVAYSTSTTTPFSLM